MTYEYSIEARPTYYSGQLMRSKLETSYAALMDGLGISWEYEPHIFRTDLGGYVPDFRVNGSSYLEIKPGNRDVLDIDRRWLLVPGRFYVFYGSDDNYQGGVEYVDGRIVGRAEFYVCPWCDDAGIASAPEYVCGPGYHGYPDTHRITEVERGYVLDRMSALLA